MVLVLLAVPDPIDPELEPEPSASSRTSRSASAAHPANVDKLASIDAMEFSSACRLILSLGVLAIPAKLPSRNRCASCVMGTCSPFMITMRSQSMAAMEEEGSAEEMRESALVSLMLACKLLLRLSASDTLLPAPIPLST